VQPVTEREMPGEILLYLGYMCLTVFVKSLMNLQKLLLYILFGYIQRTSREFSFLLCHHVKLCHVFKIDNIWKSVIFPCIQILSLLGQELCFKCML